MFPLVLNMGYKHDCNEFLIVILVISWTSLLIEASEDLADSFTVNKPVVRSNNPQPWVHFSTEYVRCFCNLPSCVHTGYMCKSGGGGCFSDLWGIAGFSAGYRGRHGCLELLNKKEKRCVNMTDTMKNPPKKKNYIHCCYRDMCNHVDSPQTKYLINTTLLSDGNDMKVENVSNQRSIGYSNSEVWFRAATIAVPICGAVILFVLIALAVKILRKEMHSSSNHKLGPTMYVQHVPSQEKHFYKYQQAQHYDYLRKQYPRAHNTIYRPTTVEMLDYQRQYQVPLLVQNEISSAHSECKNETNAKINQLHCDPLQDYLQSGGKSILLEIEKESSSVCPRINLDRNINDEIKFSDIKYGDKNYA